MTVKKFKLYDGVSTRKVNAVIRSSINKALAEYWDITENKVFADYKRTRIRGDIKARRRHVFGMHTSLRDTLVACHEGGSQYIEIVFPANYQGWDRSDFYTRLRVRAYDLILHHAGIVDPLGGMEEAPYA